MHPYQAPLHPSSPATPFPSPSGGPAGSGFAPPADSNPGASIHSAAVGAAGQVSPASPTPAAPGAATPPRQRLRGMPITPVHAAAIARLHEQLDGRAVDAAAGDYGCLDGRFELLGPHERIIGGMSRTPPPLRVSNGRHCTVY